MRAFLIGFHCFSLCVFVHTWKKPNDNLRHHSSSERHRFLFETVSDRSGDHLHLDRKHQGATCLCLPRTGIIAHATSARLFLFTLFLRTELGVSFYQLSHLSSLQCFSIPVICFIVVPFTHLFFLYFGL